MDQVPLRTEVHRHDTLFMMDLVLFCGFRDNLFYKIGSKWMYEIWSYRVMVRELLIIRLCWVGGGVGEGNGGMGWSERWKSVPLRTEVKHCSGESSTSVIGPQCPTREPRFAETIDVSKLSSVVTGLQDEVYDS